MLAALLAGSFDYIIAEEAKLKNQPVLNGDVLVQDNSVSGSRHVTLQVSRSVCFFFPFLIPNQN